MPGAVFNKAQLQKISTKTERNVQTLNIVEEKRCLFCGKPIKPPELVFNQYGELRNGFIIKEYNNKRRFCSQRCIPLYRARIRLKQECPGWFSTCSSSSNSNK
jgi:hypothetical protein